MFTKLFAAAGLLAITSALPSSQRSRSALTEREYVPCNSGTSYYKCFQYDGCFATDPCDPNKPPPYSAVKPLETHNLTRPASYNIYPLQDDQLEEDKPNHVDLLKPKNQPIVTTNLIVFNNVPKGAQNCRLMWRSAITQGDNKLEVTGKGQAWTRQLNGFPNNENVTSSTIKKYQDPNASWRPSLDFTGWGNTTSDGNMGPTLKCAEQIAVETKGSDEGEQENRVFMTLTDENGFYLSYDL